MLHRLLSSARDEGCPLSAEGRSRHPPEVLHGSTDNDNKSPRRTLLPWFVGIRDNQETLDYCNVESNCWRELAVPGVLDPSKDVIASSPPSSVRRRHI